MMKGPMTKKNTRSLDAIANDIHALERKSIFEIGDLLIEAKEQCEHGQWLDWLEDEFDWSVDTAENYMKVAELASKFRTVRNLRLAATTLYQLAGYRDEDLPAIITELAKHATKSRLAPRDAHRVIQISEGRRQFGNHPDATLYQLGEWDSKAPWYPKAVAALQAERPTTDEAAEAIVEDIIAKHKAEDKADEATAILDGAPPALPQPSPQDQRLQTGDTDNDAWIDDFDEHVDRLDDLRSKKLATFADTCLKPEKIKSVGEFLIDVAAALAAAGKKEAA